MGENCSDLLSRTHSLRLNHHVLPQLLCTIMVHGAVVMPSQYPRLVRAVSSLRYRRVTKEQCRQAVWTVGDKDVE